MKYVLMFVDRPELQAAVPAERAEQVYNEIYKWYEEHGAAGRIADAGAELQPVTTATTVHSGRDGAEPVVADGPFSDAAIAMARTWPPLRLPGVSVEVRPIVDHSGGM
jgi:hypothetical protein